MSKFEKVLVTDERGLRVLSIMPQPERYRLRARTPWGFVELWLTPENLNKLVGLFGSYEITDHIDRIGWRRTIPHQIHDTFIHVELCGSPDALWLEAYQSGCTTPTEVSYELEEGVAGEIRRWWCSRG